LTMQTHLCVQGLGEIMVEPLWQTTMKDPQTPSNHSFVHPAGAGIGNAG